LGTPVQAALCTVSVAVDVHPGGPVFLFSGGRDDAAARRLDPGRSGDYRLRGNGCVPGSAGVVDSEELPALREAIANDQGFEGTDEYDPVNDDHTNLPVKAPRVAILPADESGGAAPRAEVHVLRWSAEERELQVSSQKPIRVALRLLDYPAWRVEVNGKVATPQHAETSGQMILRLPAGTQHIAVRFVRTPDRILGIFVSVQGCSRFSPCSTRAASVSFRQVPDRGRRDTEHRAGFPVNHNTPLPPCFS